MAEIQPVEPETSQREKSIVLIAMDGNEHSNAAFRCKLFLAYLEETYNQFGRFLPA